MPRIFGRSGVSCVRWGISRKSAMKANKLRRMVVTPPATSAGCFFDLELANLIHSSTKPGFKTLVSGLVVGAGRKVVRQALHAGHFVFEIVRILIFSAVTDVFHQVGR